MGKAQRIGTARDRLRTQGRSIKRLEALDRLANTPRPVAATRNSGSSAAGSTGGGTGNFLPLEGGTMTGNIAFEPKLIILNNERVDLDPGSNVPENSSYVLVSGVGNVRFIDGAERNGQLLMYQGTNTQTQVIKNANLLSLTNIVGNGTTTVTVTLPNTGTLKVGSKVNVLSTTDYNESLVTIVALTANTSFTYTSSNGSNTTPNASGEIQDGNIITPDGGNIYLDGTLSSTNVPIVQLIFDVTAPGFGAWRVLSTPHFDSTAVLKRTTNEVGFNSEDTVSFDNNVISGSGIVDETATLKGVFKLVGHQFALEIHLQLAGEGNDDFIDFQWQRADDVNFTTNVTKIGTIGRSISAGNSDDDKNSTMPFAFAQVNAEDSDVFIRLRAETDEKNDTGVMAQSTVAIITSALSGGGAAGSGGGGGGLSEPVILGINTLTPQTSPTVTSIAWNTKNPQHLVLDRNITFSFDSLPTSGSYEGILVIIDIDSTGGYDSPIWPASVANPPIIPTTPNTRTSVMLYTINGGATVTHATSVGSSSGGGEFFGPWTANHNAGTFDLINLDSLAFQSTAGTLSSVNVGFSSLGGGGFRANILTTGKFEWTEENVDLMKLSASAGLTRLDLTGVLSSEINLFETNSSKSGTILQGSTTLQYTTTGTTHEFVVGVESVAQITDQGIIMQGTNFVKTPQIGFSITGNLIEDSASGLALKTVPGDGIFFGDGTNVFAESNNTRFDIGLRFHQLGSIVSPGVTGSNTLGRIFMDSGNSNRLSIIRNGSIIDLEASASSPLTTKGDVFGFSTVAARIPVGANGQILTADDGVGLGVKWAAAAASGATIELDNLGTTAVNTFINMGTNFFTFNPSTVRIGTAASGILNIEFPTGAEQLRLLWNTSTTPTTDWQFSQSVLTGANIILDNTFTINDSSTDPVNNGEFVRNGTVLGLQIPQFEIKRVSTGIDGPQLRLFLDTSSPFDDDVVGSVIFKGRDSANNIVDYAKIEGISRDTDSADINGALNLKVTLNGVMTEVFSINSIGNNTRVSFFGATGAAKQTITGSRGGNAALQDLLTSLANLGLITDSTT